MTENEILTEQAVLLKEIQATKQTKQKLTVLQDCKVITFEKESRNGAGLCLSGLDINGKPVSPVNYEIDTGVISWILQKLQDQADQDYKEKVNKLKLLAAELLK